MSDFNTEKMRAENSPGTSLSATAVEIQAEYLTANGSTTIQMSSNTSTHAKKSAIRRVIEGHNINYKRGVQVVPPKKSKPSIWYGVRDPDPGFEGREEFLEDLHQTIQSSQGENVTILSQVKVVTGLGGVGKTEVALKYIEKFREFYNNNVVWINADSEDTLRNSFLDLAQERLGINIKTPQGRPKHIKDILEEVYKIICQDNLLLVFDNADDHGHQVFLKQYLPDSAADVLINPFVLITSRSQDWSSLHRNITMVELDVLSNDEAVRFILRQLDLLDAEESRTVEIEGLRESALELVQLLGNLPLALQQAVAYIKAGILERCLKSSIQEYITEYKKIKAASRLIKFPPLYSSTTTDVTVYTTWNVTLNKIKTMNHGQLAVDLLNTLALLSPDNNPVPLVVQLFEHHQVSKDDVISGLILLERYRMIKNYAPASRIPLWDSFDFKSQPWVEEILTSESRKARRLGVHRQVQRVIIQHLLDQGSLQKVIDQILDPSRDIVEKMKPAEESYKDTLNSMAALASHLDLLELSEGRTSKILFKQMLANFLMKIGNFANALSMTQQVYEVLKTDLGENHKTTLTSQSNIACMHLTQGDYETALAMFESIYQRCLLLFGPDHDQTMTVLFSIGSAQDELGRYAESLQNAEKALNFLRNVWGENDSRTFDMQHNLIITLQKMGAADPAKFVKASELCQQLVERRAKVLGSDHEDTLSSKNLLAVIHYDLNNIEKALEIYKEVIQAQIRVLGQDHPETLRTIVNQSTILLNQDRFEEAQPWYQKLVDQMTVVMGPNHPNTLDAQINLAICFEHLKDFQKSYEIFQTVFQKIHKILKPQHEKTSFVQHRIAQILEKMQDYAGAEQHWRVVLNWRLENLGPSKRETWRIQENLARVLLKQTPCRRTEALQILRQLYQAQSETVGVENQDCLRTLGNITESLKILGEVDEALILLKERQNLRAKVFGAIHPTTMRTVLSIFEILHHKSRYREAEELLQPVFEHLFELKGIQDEDTICYFHFLSICYNQTKNYDSLMPLYQRVLQEQEKVFGADHQFPLSTRHNMGQLWKKLGKLDKALELLQEVLECRRKTLGELNQDTIHVQHDLAKLLKKMGRLEEALDLIDKVINSSELVEGPSTQSQMTLCALHNKVAILRRSGKFEDAFELVNVVLVQENSLLGPDSPDIPSTQLNLALLFKERGEFEKYVELLKLVYEKRKQILGLEHPKTVRVENLVKNL